MKNIKLRIVYLILGAALLLLFALFMLAVNLIIPAHFVREAKRRSSARHSTRTAPSPIPTKSRSMTRARRRGISLPQHRLFGTG
ncbi:MAG: hypothetical protein ACLT3E_09070 [Anaerovoracaceae bacterium]